MSNTPLSAGKPNQAQAQTQALPRRDPAFQQRLLWSAAALLLLWPLLVATEFKPWVLLQADSLRVSAHFLGSFWPLAHEPEFLLLVARETWRTVAIATAGIVLALKQYSRPAVDGVVMTREAAARATSSCASSSVSSMRANALSSASVA